VPWDEPPTQKIKRKEVIKMLYFVKAEPKGVPPMPPEQWMELLVKQFEIEISYQKQGKILAQGDFAGGTGGCYIFDVESNEELHRLIAQIPTHAFLDTEVIPLLSKEQNTEILKQVLSSMRESKK
jgi:muconolactone delta-isomerase